MRLCIKHGIYPELMERLNYTDLMYLVIEYEINEVKEYLRQLEEQRLNKKGVEVQELSPEDVTKFLGGGRHK